MVALVVTRRKKKIMNKTIKVLVAVLVAVLVVTCIGVIFLSPSNQDVEQSTETYVNTGVTTSMVGSSTTAQ